MKLEITAGYVYTFKLNSGEELIAKVLEIHDDFLDLENPFSIAPNHQGMGLIPSLFTTDPQVSVRLNTNSVAIMGITDDSVKNKYLEATTGLKIPDKKILVG